MPLIFVPQNFHIYKRSGHKFPRKTGGLKHQLPSLVDHFEWYFSHTTGEGLQLWFWSLLDIIWRWEPLHLAMSGVAGKNFPAGHYSPLRPLPLQPFILLRKYVIAWGCLCFALPFVPLSSSTSSLYLSSFVLFVFGSVFVFCLSILFFLLCLYLWPLL